MKIVKKQIETRLDTSRSMGDKARIHCLELIVLELARQIDNINEYARFQ